MPTIDADGNIIIGSDGKDMVIISPDGQVTTRLRLNDKFGRVVSSSLPEDQMLVLVGEKNLLTIGHLPDQWNPDLVDVQPSEIKDEWEIVNTISIDIGADVVHNVVHNDRFLGGLRPQRGRATYLERRVGSLAVVPVRGWARCTSNWCTCCRVPIAGFFRSDSCAAE